MVPSAQAGVGLSGAAVSPDTAKVVAATFNALALKYGPRVAKFIVTRAIPGAGIALLAKDLYDLGNAAYDIMLQKGIINGPAAEFGIDEDDEGVFEKRRHDKVKSKAVVSKFKDSAAAGMPGPDDLEPDDDEEDKLERKVGVPKSESPIWKELKPYRGNIRTNGLSGGKERFYEWDHLHNEIEVYGPGGREHLGAMDSITGRMIKPGEIARTIRNKL